MRNLAWMLLVVVLGWLGALILRPEVGTELVTLFSSQAVAQSSSSSPNSFTTPYYPGSPVQASDPSRPVSWPGAAVDALPTNSTTNPRSTSSLLGSGIRPLSQSPNLASQKMITQGATLTSAVPPNASAPNAASRNPAAQNVMPPNLAAGSAAVPSAAYANVPVNYQSGVPAAQSTVPVNTAAPAAYSESYPQAATPAAYPQTAYPQTQAPPAYPQTPAAAPDPQTQPQATHPATPLGAYQQPQAPAAYPQTQTASANPYPAAAPTYPTPAPAAPSYPSAPPAAPTYPAAPPAAPAYPAAQQGTPVYPAAQPAAPQYPGPQYPQQVAPVQGPPQQQGPQQPQAAAPPAPKGPHKYQGADVLARVGMTEVVLAHEVLPGVEELLERYADKINPEELDATREMLTKQRTQQLVETKLVVAEARKNIPADNLPKLETKVRESFEKEQLPRLLEAQKVANRADLEILLKQKGTSLEGMRRAYFERSVAAQWLHQQMKDETEITHEQMLKFYREHAKEYETEASARWEHLQASFSKFDSKAQAYQAIAQWGNQIINGASFASIATQYSDDPSAVDGGENPWTTKGSLVSTQIDAAVFGLPPGRLSQIIEDDRGFHIIRVMERKEFSRKPFVEAQAGIKKQIKEDRQNDQQMNYLDKLRAKTPVWTVFDVPNDGTRTAAGPSAQTR